MRKVFYLGLLSVVSIGLLSCKEPNRKVAVTSVAVNPTEKTLKVGEEFVIASIVSPENASDKTVLWSSSNPNVATVSVDGRVSAIANGVAAITATTKDGSKTATCNVTVGDSYDKIDMLYIYYLRGGGIGTDYHIYRLSLVTPGTRDSRGIAIKDGVEFRFIFCSDKPDDKFNPTKGEYNPSKGGEDFSKMTFNISQSYSFVRRFNAKDETKESVAFAEGKLVIDENKIIFTGKDTKGNSYNIAYEGNYTNMIDDTSTENHWKYEPKTPTTKTENFTSATFTDYKDHFQNGTKYLYVLMKKQENQQILTMGGLGFVIDKNKNELLPGTFNVSDTKKVGTLWKSIGFIEQSVMGCALMYQKYVTEVYYINSGTAVVTKNEIKFTGNSHFGSTINIDYKGDIPYFGPDPWELEPKQPTTKTEDFTVRTFLDYKDWFKNGTRDIYVTLKKDNDKIWATLEFILEKNATSLKAGTYNVSDSKSAGTLLKSSGRINQVITGTALWYWSQSEFFFIESGTAIVTADEIKFVGKSHFGSTINVNYKGDMTVTNP